jgi:hypothetical protein
MASKYLDYSKVTEEMPAGDPTGSFYMVVYSDTGAELYRSTVGGVVTTRTPDDVRWDDLRAPATAINPPGAVSDPDIDEDGTLLFDDGGVEQVAIIFQMPHAWKEGSAISPHLHWSKTTDAAGDVEWEYRYRVIGIGEVPPAWSTWTAADSRSAEPGATQAHTLDAFPDIDMTGQTLSSIVSFQIRRNPAAADDNYAADARLWEFDVHYQIDSRGSAEEFVK